MTLVDAQHRNAAIYSKDITGEEAFDDSKLEIYKDAKLIDVEPLTRKLDKTVLTRDKVDVLNGVIYSPYEIFSNTPIPESIKQWLTKKGITFTELLD